MGADDAEEEEETMKIKRNRKLLCGVLPLLVAVLLCRAAVPALGDAQEKAMMTMKMEPSTAVMNETEASVLPLPEDLVTGVDLRDLTLCPGGMAFGVRFLTEGVTVVGFCDVEQVGGAVNPAANAGLKIKDVILRVNGEPLSGAAQLTDRIENSGGQELTLRCRRNREEFDVRLTPVWSDAESRYKTGIWVRDSGAGIGTVTFVLPESGAFAGLGHGICDADTGELIPMKRGSVSDVTISAVVRGAPGNPGELKGYFNAGKVGALLGNTVCGVWGVFSELPDGLSDPVPAGGKDDLHEGDAVLLCTLADNRVGEYHVRISNVNRDANGPKCFTVTVTDPALLAETGGIVQGMSGSPILQDGKLVGAVTHVLINDPTTGYGIFLENMLARMPVAAR